MILSSHAAFSMKITFFPDCSTVIRVTLRLVAGTPRFVAGNPRYSETCPRCSMTCCRCSHVLPGAPKVLSSAPRCSQSNHHDSHGTPVAVIRDPSYFEGRPECCPRVWYSPEIDALKFTFHILADTPTSFLLLIYILLMCRFCTYPWSFWEVAIVLEGGQENGY